MKRSFFLCLSSIFLYVGCVGVRNQQDSKDQAFKPALPFEPVQLAENTKHPGHAVYMKSCYQCHQQAHPASLSTEKWNHTVPEMAKHAGISEEDGAKVLDYILFLKSNQG